MDPHGHRKWRRDGHRRLHGARTSAWPKRSTVALTVFAFGAVLYEMLAGLRAFLGTSASDTLSAILRDEPPLLTEIDRTIPPSVELIARRCLAKAPENRFQSAADLVAALEAVVPSHQTASGRWSAAAWGVASLDAHDGDGAGGWPRLWQSAWSAGFSRDWSIVPTVEVASIVALPAKVYGADEFHYLTDAIPATLSTHLAQVEGLDTKVPPTSLAFEQLKGDVQRIAEVFQVSACVLSSVSVERERLVLDVQLVEPRTRRVRWSKQYQGSREGYIALVSEAAEGLRRALEARKRAGYHDHRTVDEELRSGAPPGARAVHANRFNNRHAQSHFDLALASLHRCWSWTPRSQRQRPRSTAFTRTRSKRRFRRGSYRADGRVGTLRNRNQPADGQSLDGARRCGVLSA